MIRRQANFLCLLTFFTADALLIGAVAVGPRVPVKGPIIALRTTPPPSPPIPGEASAAKPAATLPSPTEPKHQTTKKAIKKQIGVASWYGGHWQGHVTASGTPFDDSKMTAAHRTLPLNTEVRVTSLKTGRSVKVTITDRGPYVRGRVIDLSKAAAKKLGMVKKGLLHVEITTLKPPPAVRPPQRQAKVASLDTRS